tara:strand:+ start:262 stop:387 length:126 start_codon:yes stop_codon:yes gene_type:complete
METREKSSWKIWAFVFGLNIIAALGAFYLQSKGINVFALKG